MCVGVCCSVLHGTCWMPKFRRDKLMLLFFFPFIFFTFWLSFFFLLLRFLPYMLSANSRMIKVWPTVDHSNHIKPAICHFEAIYTFRLRWWINRQEGYWSRTRQPNETKKKSSFTILLYFFAFKFVSPNNILFLFYLFSSSYIHTRIYGIAIRCFKAMWFWRALMGIE